MIRFAAIIFAILLVDCSFLGIGNKQPIKILNNNGGFSHGGRKIELMQDGSALVTTYSDAIGDSKSKRGTYELDHDLLLIRYHSGGVIKLQKVTYKGQDYWEDPSVISRVTEDSNEGVRRRSIALKTE